ncbi:MAG: hypothetical protein ACQESW_01660 [Bacteroidota bacterium]
MGELISKSQLEQSKKEEKYVLLTAEQVRKDFAMFGLDVEFSGQTAFVYQELFTQLEKHIAFLLERNYEKLMSLLYQIDLGQKELQKAGQVNPYSTVAELITHMILERELKKVLTRAYFKQKGL